MGSLPAETTLDEIIVRIKKTNTNPNVRSVTSVVLKEGPRAFRIATLFELIKSATGEFHHYSLRIDQVDKTKLSWTWSPDKSVSLEGESPDEIERLYSFLRASLSGKFKDESGELRLLRSEEYAKLEPLIKALPNLSDADKFQLVKNVLSQVDGADSTIKEFAAAFEGSSEQTIRHIAAASRLVQYKEALAELRRLVNDPATAEPKFQKHLEQNPWLFGSEYSELLERRAWSRDERLDYMLRRTADNYLEIVEIKTAFAEPLFHYDDSRGLYYPASRLSKVIGQVMKYIDEVERNRDHIRVKDKEDTLKIRVRAILGRDHDTDHQAALRNLNDHLHGIEILTFDQLIRIGERMMSIFEVPNQKAKQDCDDDIPF